MKDNRFNNKHSMKDAKIKRQPKFDITPIRAEIHIPAEVEMVKIPIDEYAGLVTNSAMLDAVKNVIIHDRYDNYTTLRNILGIEKCKEDGEE